MSFLKHIGLAIAALLALALPAFGAEPTAQELPEESQAFIQDIADRTLAVLDDISLTQYERDQKYHDLLKEGFEIDYLAKLVLGRHRRTASKEQLAEFQRLFPDYIIDVYSTRLQKYGDESFVTTGTAPAGENDIYVQSTVTRKGRDPFEADWRVRMMDGKLRIIDVKIEGISMLQTQRDEFSARIANVGFDGLLQDLRDKTQETDNQTQ